MKIIKLVTNTILIFNLVSCNQGTSPKEQEESVILKPMVHADTTQIPAEVRSQYYNDAALLALRDIQNDEKKRISDIEIPDEMIERYYHSLLHIYNDTTSTARDSVVRQYGIHCFLRPASREVLIGVDSTIGWVKNWMNLNPITGVTEIDTLIQKYNLSVRKYYKWSPTNCAVLRSESALNTQALSFSFSKISGIKYAEPNNPYGDGNDITGRAITDYVELIFSVGYGDCPAGCIKRHYWRFRVSYNGIVQFIDSYGSDL